MQLRMSELRNQIYHALPLEWQTPPVTAFQVIFENHMLKHIQQCTNVEARRVLAHEEWKVSLCELNAFIALLYIRGPFGGKNFPLQFLKKKWGVSFFQHTILTKRCREQGCGSGSDGRGPFSGEAEVRKFHRFRFHIGGKN